MKFAIRATHTLLALLLSSVLAMPVSAAPRATRSSRRSMPSRYRGVPTFADPTKEDVAGFDDPIVPQAPVEALGRYNRAVVAPDPNTRRILARVHHKLAFTSGFRS